MNAKWEFHPAFGLRLGLGGWQGKGAVVSPEHLYKFNFLQLNADLTVDLTDLFGGFKHDRICTPYIFGGIGGMYAFNNKKAAVFSQQLDYLWENKAFLPVRFGTGVDFRLGDLISLGLEADANVLSDRFNSKDADNADWHFNLLAGITFHLGSNHRPSAAYAAAVAAENAALAEAAKEAAAAAIAQQKAAEEAEEAALAMQKAEEAAEEAASDVAEDKAAVGKENEQNVFFKIGSSVISVTEKGKLEVLSQWLKDNPDYNVLLVGHADNATGTHEVNMTVAGKRAEAVKAELVAAGIAPERIELRNVGDTVQPFEEIHKNRVVICTPW